METPPVCGVMALLLADCEHDVDQYDCLRLIRKPHLLPQPFDVLRHRLVP